MTRIVLCQLGEEPFRLFVFVLLKLGLRENRASVGQQLVLWIGRKEGISVADGRFVLALGQCAVARQIQGLRRERVLGYLSATSA